MSFCLFTFVNTSYSYFTRFVDMKNVLSIFLMQSARFVQSDFCMKIRMIVMSFIQIFLNFRMFLGSCMWTSQYFSRFMPFLHLHFCWTFWTLWKLFLFHSNLVELHNVFFEFMCMNFMIFMSSCLFDICTLC